MVKIEMVKIEEEEEEERMVRQIFLDEWELLPLEHLPKKWEDEADYVVRMYPSRQEFVNRLMSVAKMYHPDPKPILEGLAERLINVPVLW